jgi:hypothetical protein
MLLFMASFIAVNPENKRVNSSTGSEVAEVRRYLTGITVESFPASESSVVPTP